MPSNISSSSNQLMITFHSDEWYKKHGFNAKIHTDLRHEKLQVDSCTISNPCQKNQGHCQSDEECQGNLKCGNDNCPPESGYHAKDRCCYDYCSQWLDMDNGVITSPWYPYNYPSDLRCDTLITVGMTIAGPRTITLEFRQFKVCSNTKQIFCASNQFIYSSYEKAWTF